MNEFLKTLLSRRSIRVYDGSPIDASELETILLAGANAPSAHDSRPWHFVAAASDAGKARLATALTDRFAQDLRAGGFSQAEIDARLARASEIYRTAGAVIVVFVSTVQRANPLAKTAQTEQLMASQSAALAAGQMLLAAHGLGLGACWFAAPLFCGEAVCDACKMDSARWQPQALLSVGRPAQQPKEKPPVNLQETATFL